MVGVRAPLVADLEAPAAVEPGERALDLPAVAAQALARLDPLAGDAGLDVAAAQAAIALKAKRLVFMSDVPGLLSDPQNPDSVISHLKVIAVQELKDLGVIDKGMIPKVDSAVAALRSGVDKVSFVDGRVAHAVLLEIFTDAGVGTEVVL